MSLEGELSTAIVALQDALRKAQIEFEREDLPSDLAEDIEDAIADASFAVADLEMSERLDTVIDLLLRIDEFDAKQAAIMSVPLTD